MTSPPIKPLSLSCPSFYFKPLFSFHEGGDCAYILSTFVPAFYVLAVELRDVTQYDELTLTLALAFRG